MFIARLMPIIFIPLLLTACGGDGSSDDGNSVGEGTDSTPDVFSFIDVDGATISANVTSNSITIAGIDTTSTISIIGGEYSIDGGSFSNVSGDINNGQTVEVKLTTSINTFTTSDAVLTIGGISDTFSVTTFDNLPNSFTFTDQINTSINATLTSNEITVSGINLPTRIRITGGEYSINNGTFADVTVDDGISNGDTIRVRLVSSANLGTTEEVTLFLGNLSGISIDDTFSVATQTKVTFTNFQNADVVIGQADFTGISENQGGISPNANTLDYNYGNIAINDGVLYVGDSDNNRILGFNSVPTVNNTTANFVLGQDNFTSNALATSASTFSTPQSVVFENDKMLMLDYDNNRALIWNTIPTTDIPADVVVGQADMTSSASACTQSNLSSAESLTTINGKLLVADSDNHRVLIWNTMPTSNGQPADIVLGQFTFDSCLKNIDGSTDAGVASLNSPTGIWTDGTRLVVLDRNNNRALIWQSFPTENGQSADVVLGQSTFESNVINAGGVSASSLKGPYIGVFSNGSQLFITDNGNSRVLIWDTFPSVNGQAATTVLGQSDFSHNKYNDDDQNDIRDSLATARTLAFPTGIFQAGNQLFVSDTENSRILIYNGQ